MLKKKYEGPGNACCVSDKSFPSVYQILGTGLVYLGVKPDISKKQKENKITTTANKQIKQTNK